MVEALSVNSGLVNWKRSNIVLVGSGRAGKTSTAKSILGESFRHTESTLSRDGKDQLCY